MNRTKLILAAVILFILAFIFLFAGIYAGTFLIIPAGILIMIVMVTWSQEYGKKTLKETMKQAYIEGTAQGDQLSILKTRYAKGEITREQYEQMKKDLKD